MRFRLPPPPFLDARGLLETSQAPRVEKCLEQAQRVERLLLMYFFYILQCKGDRLYVGSCENLERRFQNTAGAKARNLPGGSRPRNSFIRKPFPLATRPSDEKCR